MGMPEDDPPPGVPEWVVTYGDMMSLLLTFFIMLVSLSEVAGDKKYLQVLESLQKGIGYRAGQLSPPGKNFPLNSMLEQLKTLGSHSDTAKGNGGVKTPPSVEGKDKKVYMQRHGNPIPAGQPVLFERFDAQLSADSLRKLQVIAESLAGKPNKIEIRAHTSSQPLPEDSPYRNHFALAYARAKNVFNALATLGVENNRMRMIAVGDNEPPELAADAMSIQADRVAIVVLDINSDMFVGPKDDGK